MNPLATTNAAIKGDSTVILVTWPVKPSDMHQKFMGSSVSLPSCDSRIIRGSLG